MAIQSANPTVLRVMRTAPLSISQLYFASISISLQKRFARRALRRSPSQLLQLYTDENRKRSVKNVRMLASRTFSGAGCWLANVKETSANMSLAARRDEMPKNVFTKNL